MAKQDVTILEMEHDRKVLMETIHILQDMLFEGSKQGVNI